MVRCSRSKSVKFFQVLCGFALAFSYTTSPHANGRFPSAGYVVVGPGSDRSVIALRATFGLLLSYDGGRRWNWVCEEAFGGANGYDPSLAIGFDGAVLSTVPLGLSIAAGGATGGCTWHPPRGAPTRSVADIAVDASGRVMFSVTGPSGIDDTIYRSTDGGATWEARASLPGLFTETIEVAPSNPSRVYVSGFLRGGIPVLYRSDDGGMTLREMTRDFGRGGSAFISGVDPTNPDVLYIRSSVGIGTVLLRSVDGGTTLREVASTLDTMSGFALSDDGSTVWIGSVNRSEGISRSIRGGPFRRVAATVTTRCLRYHAGVLYVCADEAEDGFLLGHSIDGGDRIDPLLSGRLLTGVGDRCDRSTPAATICNDLWPPVRMALAMIDAGPPPSPVFYDAAVATDTARDVLAESPLDAAIDVLGENPVDLATTDTPTETTSPPPDTSTDTGPDTMPDPAPDIGIDIPLDASHDLSTSQDGAIDTPPHGPDTPHTQDAASERRPSSPPAPPRGCACQSTPSTDRPVATFGLATFLFFRRQRRRRPHEGESV